jgi:hypothetical protein
MKYLAALTLSWTFAFAPLVHAAGLQKIAYPTAEEASFVISAPKSWEITAAENDGDYFHLESPSGAVFSFRTIAGNEESLNAAIEKSVKDLNKRFDAVELGDAEDWKPNGLTGLYAVGTGKEKDDGTPIKVGLGWCALEDGKIAEMWFVADEADAKGLKQAEDIANSLTAPEGGQESSSSKEE